MPLDTKTKRTRFNEFLCKSKYFPQRLKRYLKCDQITHAPNPTGTQRAQSVHPPTTSGTQVAPANMTRRSHTSSTHGAPPLANMTRRSHTSGTHGSPQKDIPLANMTRRSPPGTHVAPSLVAAALPLSPQASTKVARTGPIVEIFDKNPKRMNNATIIFINKLNEVLFVRETYKKNTMGGSMWTTPGGKIDEGDVSDYAAACREFKEETSFRVISHNNFIEPLRTFHYGQKKKHTAVFLIKSLQQIDFDKYYNAVNQGGITNNETNGIAYIPISDLKQFLDGKTIEVQVNNPAKPEAPRPFELNKYARSSLECVLAYLG